MAVALGDDLAGAAGRVGVRIIGAISAHAHELAPLPDGAEPLIRFVQAPQALTPRLTMTGLTAPDAGARLQPELKPGQRLVSQRGDLWRWDGYSASADAPSAAAVRLAQRNRLAALEERDRRREGDAQSQLVRSLFGGQGCDRGRTRKGARRPRTACAAPKTRSAAPIRR